MYHTKKGKHICVIKSNKHNTLRNSGPSKAEVSDSVRKDSFARSGSHILVKQAFVYRTFVYRTPLIKTADNPLKSTDTPSDLTLIIRYTGVA